jgi:hypothetical protein
MTTQHTPGPWAHDGYGNITGMENDPEIGCVGKVGVASIYLRTAAYRYEANARLIAAAPDLLSVLKELQESAAYWSEYDVPLGIVERINAAVAKAEGGAV